MKSSITPKLFRDVGGGRHLLVYLVDVFLLYCLEDGGCEVFSELRVHRIAQNGIFPGMA
ncbi:hypothetical protein [Candidatus Alkanophaga liquidiphilum]